MNPMKLVLRVSTILVAILGLWTFTAAFEYGTNALIWNGMIVGMSVAFLAGENHYRASEYGTVNFAAAGLTAALGIWLVGATTLVFDPSTFLLWNNVVAGVVVTGLASYNAYATWTEPVL